MNTRYWNKTNLYRQVDALKKELQSLYVFNATGIDSKGLAYQCVNNLAIREIPFDNTKICGILYKGDRKTAIGLNVNRTPEMQNFDCMHELIHYFFHDICYCQCICSDEQSGEYIQQDRIQEWQANEGAAQFLVPYQDFIPRFTKLLNSGVTGVQSILAEYYNVTTQVINIRMDSLAYEINQYQEGVRLDCLELLSRNQRKLRGITTPCYQARCDFALDWDSVIGL